MRDDACEGAFRTVKAYCVLAYPTREGHFVLSTGASNVGISALFEQEQDDGGRVAKKVIDYASKTLSNSQPSCSVMAVELFRYYLRYLT